MMTQADNYTCLIIDDEQAAQDVLLRMLSLQHPQFRILQICSSVKEGIECIRKHKPQLVFMDVQMPPGTGFDVLQETRDLHYEVIFTTSYEEYAIHAFKVSAVDYLLKPFSPEQLSLALSKFKEKLESAHNRQHIESLLQNIQPNNKQNGKIALPSSKGYVFVWSDNIVRCEADNNYTTLYMNDKSKHLVSRTLKEFEELLKPYGFFRVHASHLINLDCVAEYIKGEGGQVRLTDGSIVEVSRRKKEDFIAQIGGPGK
jgi:two-component system, LytTR family, response regulator